MDHEIETIQSHMKLPVSHRVMALDVYHSSTPCDHYRVLSEDGSEILADLKCYSYKNDIDGVTDSDLLEIVRDHLRRKLSIFNTQSTSMRVAKALYDLENIIVSLSIEDALN